MNIIKYFKKKGIDRKKSIKYIICWSVYSVSFLFEEKKAINDIFYCRLLTEVLITSVDEFLIDFISFILLRHSDNNIRSIFGASDQTIN